MTPRLDRSAALLASVIACVGVAEAVAQSPRYSLVEGWADLPEGVEAWGQTIGVEIDREGRLLVFHRCFDNSCVGHDDVPPVLEYAPSGRLLGGWGEGLFVWPHGFALDPEGNVWTTDAGGADGRGHQVLKLGPDGRVLMRLGTAGVAGDGPDTFDGPTDVVVAANGDIFVADGHGNDRIVKFAADGSYLMEWGREGAAPGEFDEPHSLALDSRGRLFVGDRLNQRIQVFDQEGHFLDEWTGIMASGLHITEDDRLLVADYQLREGIVIARAEDFHEIGFIDGALGEGVTIDAHGNVYVAEVIPRNLKKFAPSDATRGRPPVGAR